MEISSELRVVKNAYLKAQSKQDTSEMKCLKTKAMAIKSKDKSTANTQTNIIDDESKNSKGVKSIDGDTLEISHTGTNLSSSKA